MMGPDYTHWHGTYEVARRFYSEFVPEFEALIASGKASSDPTLRNAADALQATLDKVLTSDDHKWYVNKMDPEEAKRRKQSVEDFQKRYGK